MQSGHTIFLQYLEPLVWLLHEFTNKKVHVQPWTTSTTCMLSAVIRGHLFLVLLNPLFSNDCQCCAVLYGLDHVVHVVHQEEGWQRLVFVCLGLHNCLCQFAWLYVSIWKLCVPICMMSVPSAPNSWHLTTTCWQNSSWQQADRQQCFFSHKLSWLVYRADTHCSYKAFWPVLLPWSANLQAECPKAAALCRPSFESHQHQVTAPKHPYMMCQHAQLKISQAQWDCTATRLQAHCIHDQRSSLYWQHKCYTQQSVSLAWLAK